MALMDWSDALDVGVEDMNREHKDLLAYMNKLYELHGARSSFEDQKKVLSDFRLATMAHFQHEESYMQEIHWEDLHQHKLIHYHLLENFTKHYSQFLQDGHLSEEFFYFLKYWLTAHIQGIDKKYGGKGRNG